LPSERGQRTITNINIWGASMARKRYLVIVLASVLALSLVACGDDDSGSDQGSDSGGVTVTTGDTGTPVAVELGETSDTEYFMTVTPDSVPAGLVTFTAKNTGEKEHEMVVLKTDEAADALTVTDDRVSEDASVGEVSETPAGKTGTLTVDLEPGSYVLVCNIEKHYSRHMYAAFTVT
jgi:uncharacterized cupredoxin-like copper-binding protein